MLRETTLVEDEAPNLKKKRKEKEKQKCLSVGEVLEVDGGEGFREEVKSLGR